MKLVGLCGSDAHIYRADDGYEHVIPGTVLGHEGIGVIESIPEGTETAFTIGDRVVPLSIIGCGRCSSCKTGSIQHCSQRQTLGVTVHGLLQDRVSAEPHNLVKVPPNVPDRTGVLTEPFAIAFHGAQKALINRQQSSVFISGTGTVAWLTALAVRSLGHHVSVLGRTSPRSHHYRTLARSLGIDFHESALLARPDIWIECSGSTSCIEQALSLLPPGGRICLVALYPNRASVDWNLAIRNEIDVVTSYGANKSDFEEALKLLAIHTDLGEKLTSVHPLQEYADAFASCAGLAPRGTQFAHKQVLSIHSP
ncbi:zinc-dependent alcohol dehydrogenase [Corynebacterium flavescens]